MTPVQTQRTRSRGGTLLKQCTAFAIVGLLALSCGKEQQLTQPVSPNTGGGLGNPLTPAASGINDGTGVCMGNDAILANAHAPGTVSGFANDPLAFNCTANDVRIANASTASGTPIACFPGDPINDIDIVADVVETSTSVRHDIGIWIENGDNGAGGAEDGTCDFFYFDAADILAEPAVIDADSDECGDMDNAGTVEDFELGDLDLICPSSPVVVDGMTFIEVASCVSWTQPGGDRECGLPGASFDDDVRWGTLPANKSKCNCEPFLIPVEIQGKIIVVKQTIPDGDATDFTFTGDAAGAIADGEMIMEFVSPGTYTSTETVPSGWDLTSISCDDGGSASPSSGNTGTATATFNVESGEIVTCTFTNTKRGSIKVVKQTLPDGDTTDFTFTGDAAGAIADGEMIGPVEVMPGTYSSTETVPSGWDLTDISCDDGGSASPSSGNTGTGVATFNVEAGEDVTCTFTNTKRGSIKVEKQTDPDGDTTDFTFTGDAAGDIADGEMIGPIEVVPGTYTSTETVPSDWDLTDISCDDGGSASPSSGNTGTATATFNVEPGEDVKCTFSNRLKRGKIIVVKQTIPDGDTTDFTFTGDAAGDIADGEMIMVDMLLPGTYTSTETVTAGWDLTDISCDDGGSASPSSGNTGTATATFNVDPDETVTCTFTNTKRGSIKVVKQTLPDGDTTDFTFTGDAAGDIADGEMIGPISKAPGAYSSTETVPAGWDLTDISCDDGGSASPSSGDTGTATATFNVEAGEDVVCTFTNTKRGKIIVEKQTIPDGDPATFTFSGDVADTIGDGQTAMTDNLVPGSYSSTETVPVGWDLTDVSCDDGASDTASSGSTVTATASFELDPGETVTCTFTNTKRAMVTVNKTESGGLPLNTAFQFQIRSGANLASSGTIIAEGSADLVTGVVDFSCAGGISPDICENDGGIAKIVPGDYQLCEVGMMPGWMNNIPSPPGFTPNGETAEGGDNSSECVDITLGAGAMGVPSEVPDPIDNTPPPGGDARTIGFWKNWTSCDGHGNQDPVLDQTLALAGGTILLGPLAISNCEDAVAILDKRDLSSGKKRANDACYGLAAQLLAAKLNVVAGAGVCAAATNAIVDGDALLTSVGFDGTGKCLRPQDGSDYQDARTIAGILDDYNNNQLCSP